LRTSPTPRLAALWGCDEAVAGAAIRAAGSLRALLADPSKAAGATPGVGAVKARQAGVVMELARRSLLQAMAPRSMLSDPASAKRFFLAWLRDRGVEQFCALFLDTRHRVIACETLSVGTLNGTSVYPREVVKRAMELGADAVIFAHNHPSGVAEPSDADRRMTRRLRDALSLVDIRTLDHLVVGDGAVTSFAEQGLI